MLELLLGSRRKQPKNISIGPTALIGSNATAGFYGEVASADFISGSALASSIGLTVGVARNDGTPWLKFFIDDKIVFIPKLPIRYALSWQDLYLAGAVYGSDTFGRYPISTNTLQNKRVTIGGYQFRVRLMRGANSDPAPFPNTGAINDPGFGAGSEWNRLMYNITDSPANKASQVGPNWAHYTELSLGINDPSGIAVYNWTQEKTDAAEARGTRGSPNITSVFSGWTDTRYNTVGWRPILELVA